MSVMVPICKKKISLLSFDLDGTLLDDAGEISELTLEQIHAAMDKGVKVTISSGRIPSMQRLYVSQLDFDGPYIASNGALILNSIDDSVIYSKPIEEDILAELCVFCRTEQMHLCLQTMKNMYYTQNNPRVSLLKQYDSVAEKHGFSKVPMQILDRDYSNFDNSPTYKALVYVPDKQKYSSLVNYLDNEPRLIYTFSDQNLFEISVRGVDKGQGIQIVANHYGIPLNEVCAFGDFDNDIPLFEQVGLSIAMGNGSNKLKNKAMYITDSNVNEGVAKAIANMASCFVSSWG